MRDRGLDRQKTNKQTKSFSMAENWDDEDGDDDWDVDDDELDKKLGIVKPAAAVAVAVALPTFDDEEDLAVTEKARADKLNRVELSKKGNALLEKKAAEQAAKDEEDLVRKAMALEAAAEASMDPEEFRALQRRQVEEADHALTNDLFGAVDSMSLRGASASGSSSATAVGAATSSLLQLNDMKDHLKHARTVGTVLTKHGQIHWSTAFFKEALTQSTNALDEDAIAELIKTLNVMKNDKVIAAKRKVKGQAQKAKKVDKAAEVKARKIQVETFGDNDRFDKYDTIGENYEDDFF